MTGVVIIRPSRHWPITWSCCTRLANSQVESTKSVMVFSVRLLCASLALLLLLISSSQRTRASSERCVLGFNQHNITALPRVIGLIAGTRLQLIMRQVDIQMDKGGKDSGSEGRRKGGSEIGGEITGKERTRVS